MTRDFADYASDMLESIQDAMDFTADLSMNDLLGDKKTLKAVIHCLEILGEAARKIPDGIQARYPMIPWKRIIGMRNKLIHEYFGVDRSMIWQVVREDLPPLAPHLRRLLDELESKP